MKVGNSDFLSFGYWSVSGSINNSGEASFKGEIGIETETSKGSYNFSAECEIRQKPDGSTEYNAGFKAGSNF